jgi:hypothetical protein
MPEGARHTPNADVARALDEVGDLLESQHANVFRVASYRRAAAAVRSSPRAVADLVARGGTEALRTLPGVGPRLAQAIAEIAATGRLGMLDRLRGETDAEVLFASVPGLGPVLAHRAHQALGLETLPQLEAAAHDGRLGRVPGYGPRRVRSVTETLATRLGRRWTPPSSASTVDVPSVAELLGVDAQYRDEAAAGRLHLIAPRRFNPERRAWLPILHTERGRRHYTALFSNTALAHRLGRSRNWVVVYLDDTGREHQWTIVTETRGSLAGRRVVRGRETECRAHYGVAAVRGLPSRRRPGNKAPCEPSYFP